MASTSLVPFSQLVVANKGNILPGDANVTPELEEAGKSFGSLLQLTGNAVAETQRKLNQASAANAVALANTMVEVIAVRETVYGDNGEIHDTADIVRKLPLVNFMDPVFYEWPEVHLQGIFMADEFAGATRAATSTSTEKTTSAGVGMNIKFGALSLSGYERRVSSSSLTQTTTMVGQDTTSDYSMGNVRLNARLVPKTDVGVPKPRQVVRGPKLNFVHENPVNDTTNPPKFRTLDLRIQYNNREGQPIKDQPISIETDGTEWSYLDNGNSTSGGDPTLKRKTDAKGEMKIQLRRTFVDTTDEKGNPVLADRSPIDITITARVGMVRNATVVTF